VKQLAQIASRHVAGDDLHQLADIGWPLACATREKRAEDPRTKKTKEIDGLEQFSTRGVLLRDSASCV
jgi:hypothetical protein